MDNANLKIEVVNNQPKSGQHVGIIPTGVIVTHISSGLKAQCDNQRSQMRNRDTAIAMIDAGLKFMESQQ